VPAKQGATVVPSTTVVAPVDALIAPATEKQNSVVKRRFHIKTTIFWVVIGAHPWAFFVAFLKKRYYLNIIDFTQSFPFLQQWCL
jgi:hypothetical protein